MTITIKKRKYFSIFNHEKEEEYLKNMHANGWKLIKVSGMCKYSFEKCPKENVVYQLDYNPQTKESRPEYLQMFKDCGWEYIQDYAGYSYFRKPAAEMNGDETIFSDDDSRISMISRVYKDRLRPLLFVLWVTLIPKFIFQLLRHNYIIACVYGGLLALYLIVFLVSAISYHNMKKK